MPGNDRYGFDIKSTVTKSSDIILTDVKIDQVFMDATVDVVDKIGGYTFVIYFEHDYRKMQGSLHREPEDKNCGIICIELATNLFLHGFGRDEQTYKNVLRESLELGTSKTEWVYHPRTKRAIDEVKSELENRDMMRQRKSKIIDIKNRNASFGTFRSKEQTMFFICNECDITFEANGSTFNGCPK